MYAPLWDKRPCEVAWRATRRIGQCCGVPWRWCHFVQRGEGCRGQLRRRAVSAFTLNVNFYKTGLIPEPRSSLLSLATSTALMGRGAATSPRWTQTDIGELRSLGKGPPSCSPTPRTRPPWGTAGCEGSRPVLSWSLNPGPGCALGNPRNNKELRQKFNSCQTMCAYRGDMLIMFLMK